MPPRRPESRPDPRADQWLTAGEAMARLGVKPQTLYAYASRGLVRRERVPGGRTRRYLRADVERLAARARRTDGGPGPEIVVDSALTRIDPAGRLAYRGWDVARAAEESTYEHVAEWLWGAGDPGEPWVAPAGRSPSPRRCRGCCPTTPASPTGCGSSRSRSPRATRCATTGGRRPSPCGRAGSSRRWSTRCPSWVHARPGSTPRSPRLWPRLTGLAPTAARLAALDSVLVLLADHELAASTFAARIAASTWADPYLVVSAGLAAAGGPLHAGASETVRVLLREVVDGTPAAVAVGERLRDGVGVPGFGHAVYEGPDPRAVVLLGALRRARPPRAVMDAVDAVAAIVAVDGERHPNIDFALGAFAEATGMVPGAGEAVFVLARCAGWVAHGLEEYPHRLRYRIRAAYTGPAPDWA